MRFTWVYIDLEYVHNAGYRKTMLGIIDSDNVFFHNIL